MLLLTISRIDLSAGQLALFSANSFLYGYYFGPLLSAQKLRVQDMQKIVYQEALVIYGILTQSHMLKPYDRHELKVKLKVYIDSVIGKKFKIDNPKYDELLEFASSKRFEGNDTMKDIYNRIAKTQEDRENLALLYSQKLFSHEWIVLFILFSITIFFVLQIDYGQSLLFNAIAASLCTGLTMLIVILAKYSTLLHKEAKSLWNPMKQLVRDHFEDVK